MLVRGMRQRITDSDIRRCSSGNGRLTLKHDDTVGQVGGHDEIVLDDERSLLGVQDEPAMRESRCDAGEAYWRTYRLMTLLAMIRCSESKNLVVVQDVNNA